MTTGNQPNSTTAPSAQPKTKSHTGVKVLACGGRSFSDYDLLCHTLNKYPITVIIHGGASGADTLAGKYAHDNNIPLIVFHANWEKYGPSAGPIRNAKMLSDGKPDMLIAFPGGRGTWNMIQQARALSIPNIISWYGPQ